MLFNIAFVSNAILSYSFFFFLIINLNFMIHAFIAQIFNPIAELVIPIEIQNKEAKLEIEIYPVNTEAKQKKVFGIIQRHTSLFVILTCQFILLYFFNEIISCFFFIFQSKSIFRIY